MDWCSEIAYLHNGRNWVGLWGQSQSHLVPDVAPVVASQEKSHRRPGWLTRKVLLPLEERNNGGAHSGGVGGSSCGNRPHTAPSTLS